MGECVGFWGDHPYVTGILCVAELAAAGAIFGNRFAVIVVGLALRQQKNVLMARSRTIADTLGEMARLMPDYVATEIPAIRTQSYRHHSRNQKKVFFLDTTAIDR